MVGQGDMPWVEHAAWLGFALVALTTFALAKSLDDRDERLDPRGKRSRLRTSERSGPMDKTERLKTRRPATSDRGTRPSIASDRPSHTSDRPSAPGDRSSSPGERPTTSATRSDSTRGAFDRGSIPPD
jgi:hypothetical protein